MEKDWKPIIIYLCGLFGVSLVVGMIAGLSGNEALFNYADTAVEIVIATVFVVLYLNRIKDGIKALKAKDYLIILGIGILLLAVNEGIVSLFEYFKVPMSNQAAVEEIFKNTNKIIFALAVAFGAPIVEEFIMRYSLGTLIKNDYIFILVSALIFGLMHGIGIAMILYVLMGAVFAIAYVKYKKNIVVPIMIHTINNIVAVISLFFI